MRSILHPAFSDSCRQRLSSFSSAPSSGASFFSGPRSIPGTVPATTQLNWLISNHGNQRPVSVQGSQASAQFAQLMHGVSIGFTSATMDAISSPPPHSIFPGGFRTTAPGDVDRLVMGPSSEPLHMCGHAHQGALLPRPTVDRRRARVDRLNFNLVRSATPSNIYGQPPGLHQSAICQPRVWCFAYTTCCGAREIASRRIC